ncbi:hypothetical protein O7632_21120 [Solwaraspora sp. WMMD406]|uniref:hypothetical protein n=1 Tax=Solwaraspora sp. WMMD406 TaxID=3016095 RepID=UPI002415E16A|nr:hypothetical protein [Solwaraspora sp. WMMD406]MDG4766579.1 hypothetical protein [Solwaraspora sp. WMMD406]
MSAPLRNSPTGTRRGGQETDSTLTDADDAPVLSGRRLLRWTAVVGALVIAVLACWQDPGYALDDGRWSEHPGTGPASAGTAGLVATVVVALLIARGTRISWSPSPSPGNRRSR